MSTELNEGYIALLVFLGIGNALFALHCIWQLYRCKTFPSWRQHRIAFCLRVLDYTISFTTLAIGTLSTLSVGIGYRSETSCYLLLKGVSTLYVFDKLCLYLFLLARGRVVQSTAKSPPLGTQLSRSAYLERIVVAATVFGVPIFLIVIAVLAHGEILPEPICGLQCAFVVPYNLAVVMLVVDVILSFSFVSIFELALREADNALAVFRRPFNHSRSMSTQIQTQGVSEDSSYKKLMKRHLNFTRISVFTTICAMAMLALGHFVPEVRAFVLPVGITDVGVNTLIVYLMTKKKVTIAPTISAAISIPTSYRVHTVKIGGAHLPGRERIAQKSLSNTRPTGLVL